LFSKKGKEMKLQLRNIGLVEEASVKINGLTVIAGENDTGKSTLGKALFCLVKSDNIARNKNLQQKEKEILATRLNLVFDGNVSLDGTISLVDDHQKEVAYAHIVDKNFVKEFRRGKNEGKRFFDATIVQSPIVFDMVDFFNSIGKMKERQKFDYALDFDITYPYVIWDLFDKISKPNPYPRVKKQRKIQEEIQKTIGGEFKLEGGKFFFYKYFVAKALKMEMANTAFGIKSFGLLQLLNENRFLNPKVCLILDEPEVHLHPKWQLAMARVIVGLVKNKVKVLVNSHSPYMVEALQRYGELEKIDSNFYIAQDGKIEQVNESNSQTLSEIFKKLSEPFETFDEMDSENLLHG
jgi:predicted ATPase